MAYNQSTETDIFPLLSSKHTNIQTYKHTNIQTGVPGAVLDPPPVDDDKDKDKDKDKENELANTAGSAVSVPVHGMVEGALAVAVGVMDDGSPNGFNEDGDGKDKNKGGFKLGETEMEQDMNQSDVQEVEGTMITAVPVLSLSAEGAVRTALDAAEFLFNRAVDFRKEGWYVN